MHQPSWLWMFPYLGRLTNKHITTTCPQRRAWVDEQRKLGFDGLKFRMPELRRLLYDDVIVLHKKRSFFITDITSIGTLMLSKGSVYQNTLYQEPIMERQRISSKRASWLRQNSWKLYTEPLLMVYKVECVYLLFCKRPIFKTGSNDVYFKSSCLMSLEWIFKRCRYM